MKKFDNHTAPTLSSHVRHYTVATAKIVGGVLLLAMLVHISWNMFAPDMFGLSAIRMKQALGLVVFASAFAVLIRFGHRKQVAQPHEAALPGDTA